MFAGAGQVSYNLHDYITRCFLELHSLTQIPLTTSITADGELNHDLSYPAAVDRVTVPSERCERLLSKRIDTYIFLNIRICIPL